MANNILFFGAAGVVMIGAAAALYSAGSGLTPAYIDPANQTLVSQGESLYANNCAACHGVELQGQPNWRQRMPNGRLPAPPHDQDGHTWHHPDDVLFDIVKNGVVPGKTAPLNYQSDMPAYGDILSDKDIRAVLAYIKSSWPAEVQQRQKEATLQQ